MSIFQVISNLNHNGTVYAAGEFLEGELAQFEHLVSDGVLRVLEGVKNLADAPAAAAALDQEAAAARENAEAASPQNTWGPKKDEEANDDADQVNAGSEVKAPEVIPPQPGQVGVGDLPPDAGDNL